MENACNAESSQLIYGKQLEYRTRIINALSELDYDSFLKLFFVDYKCVIFLGMSLSFQPKNYSKYSQRKASQ